jgi:hypothetical protein
MSRLPEAESNDVPAPLGLWGSYLISAACRRIMILADKTGFHFRSVGRSAHRQGGQVLVANFSRRYEIWQRKPILRWKNGS